MKKTQKLIINCLLFFAAIQSKAEHPVENGAGVACGELVSFIGKVEVFNSSRTHVEDIHYGKKLNCGDWISVEDGQAVLVHQAGFKLLVGKNTFLQILDPQDGANSGKDHAQLYRGEAVIDANSKNEVRITTANARAKVTRSKSLLLFTETTLETQFVGLEGQSIIENRWISGSDVRVDVAKVSVLGSSDTRIHPSDPKLIDHKSIADRLMSMGVSKELNQRIAVIVKSESRVRMPAKLKVVASNPGQKPADSHLDNQAVASTITPTGEFAVHQSYSSFDPSRGPASDLQGDNTSEKVLSAFEPVFKNKVNVQNPSRAPATIQPKMVQQKTAQQKVKTKIIDPKQIERDRVLKKLAGLTVGEDL